MLSTLKIRWLNRRTAYRRCFLAEDGEPTHAGARVLADLARYCRAYDSTLIVSPKSGLVDPLASAFAAGRRDVFWRLAGYLRLDDSKILNLREDPDE